MNSNLVKMKIAHTLKYFSLSLFASAIISAQALTVTNAPVPKPIWHGSVSAGFTLTRGNSDTALATLAAVTDRKTDGDEWTLGLNGTYGRSTTTVNGVSTASTTAQSLDGSAQFNRSITKRFYGFARTEGLYDGVADIHYRITLNPGAGYYFINNTNTDLSIEAGPGYEIERLGTNDMDFVTLRLGEKFHHALSDRARIWERAELLPEADQLNNYTINTEMGIEAYLTDGKNLTLQCYLDDSYNNQPAAGRLKNDAKLVTAIGFKY